MLARNIVLRLKCSLWAVFTGEEFYAALARYIKSLQFSPASATGPANLHEHGGCWCLGRHFPCKFATVACFCSCCERAQTPFRRGAAACRAVNENAGLFPESCRRNDPGMPAAAFAGLSGRVRRKLVAICWGEQACIGHRMQ